MSGLRVAMLTYSVRPRGGVVHALEVAAALARRGNDVELFALGTHDQSFFREPEVPWQIVRHEKVEESFDARILAMRDAYRDGLLEMLADQDYDIVHAQDCLSANAAIALRDLGLIANVIRTVHHIDDFTSPSLIECQDDSIRGPDALVCVSAPWVERIRDEYGLEAGLVSNGVDRDRYRPAHGLEERAAARARFELGKRFTVLTIGGVEPRKGSLTLLDGFAALRAALPALDPLLVIAGGATLFDYRHELERFDARLDELGLRGQVRMLGSLPDHDVELLYRAADVFAFPSRSEGFGLAALEALASGLPVVASNIPAFRTFLRDGEDALLVDGDDGAALGAALARIAGDRALQARLRAQGLRVAAQYSWDRAAAAYERAYRMLLRTHPGARADSV